MLGYSCAEGSRSVSGTRHRVSRWTCAQALDDQRNGGANAIAAAIDG
jgi:hypothetical protein